MAPCPPRTVSSHYYGASERTLTQGRTGSVETTRTKLQTPTLRSEREAVAQRRRLSSKVRTMQFAGTGSILALTDCADGVYHAEEIGVGRFLSRKRGGERVEITWISGRVTMTSWPATGSFVGFPIAAPDAVILAPTPSRKRRSFGKEPVRAFGQCEIDGAPLSNKSTIITL